MGHRVYGQNNINIITFIILSELIYRSIVASASTSTNIYDISPTTQHAVYVTNFPNVVSFTYATRKLKNNT